MGSGQCFRCLRRGHTSRRFKQSHGQTWNASTATANGGDSLIVNAPTEPRRTLADKLGHFLIGVMRQSHDDPKAIPTAFRKLELVRSRTDQAKRRQLDDVSLAEEQFSFFQRT